MVSVALSPIMNAFGVPVARVTWLVLLYLVVITSLQPTAGKLGDRFGHRRVFLAGLVAFGIASVGAALAPTFWLLTLCRVLQGLTSSTLGPNAAALIRLAYPVERQGHAMGLYVGAFSMGLAIGPVLGGLLVGSVGWQGIFWVNVPGVILSAWVGFKVLPRTDQLLQVPFDWWGTVLFGALVSGVVLTANMWKLGGLPLPLWVIAPGLAALAAVFYVVEQRANDPLIKFGLFRLPGFGASNLAVFLLHTMVYVVLVGIPLYLQQGRGLSAEGAGLQMALFSGMQLVAPLSGRWSDHLGRRIPVALGGLLWTAAWLGLLWISPGSSLLWVTGFLVVGGFGFGLTSAPVQAACLASLPRADVGVGSGVWYSARYLGNVAGALLTSLLLPKDLAAGAPVLYWTMVGVALALAAGARLLPAPRDRISLDD
jgi:MFS family permease